MSKFKYLFAGIPVWELNELRLAANNADRLGTDVVTREILRIFSKEGREAFFEWLESAMDCSCVDALARAESSYAFAELILGHDSKRLSEVKEILGRHCSVQRGLAAPSLAKTCIRETPTYERVSGNMRSVLYMIVDLKSKKKSYQNTVPSKDLMEACKESKILLRRIDPGSFLMGSPNDEPGRWADEALHEVSISEPYYIGVFPVTEKQWWIANGMPRRCCDAAFPMVGVSYNDIRGVRKGSAWPKVNGVDKGSWLGKVRQKTGIEDFDLPTEAQWEYACRANSAGPYAGSFEKMGRCAFSGKTQSMLAVGKLKPNAFGIYDMHGNVWEWCLDWYGSYEGEDDDPQRSASERSRVCRGGSWQSRIEDCRSAKRNWYKPDFCSAFLGFRLCCPAKVFDFEWRMAESAGDVRTHRNRGDEL